MGLYKFEEKSTNEMRDVAFLVIGFYPKEFKAGGKLGLVHLRRERWKH